MLLSDYGLTEEQRMMRDTCRAFVNDHVTPFIRQNWQREWLMTPEDRLPRKILEVADEIGIRTLGVPEEFGGTPPNSSGTPSARMPILSACSRMARGRRASGSISHSRCQFWRMNGVTKSSTKARQLSRISRCSSDKLRSIVSMAGVRCIKS